MGRLHLTFMVLLFITLNLSAQRDFVRWNLAADGGISWIVKPNDVHSDNIEMSGRQISAIVTYGIDSNKTLILKKQLVFPMLRTIPNNTHASFSRKFDSKSQPVITVNGTVLKETPVSFHHKGIVSISSNTNTPLKVTRTLFPSADKAAYIEIYQLKNNPNASASN